LRTPANPYTPFKSGCATGACVAGAAVPDTVTFTELFSAVLFGPVTFNVYVVLALGNTCRLPRAVTRPTPGSIVTPLGFSVAHTSVTGWPGRTAAGCAVKLTIRAGGTTRAGVWAATGQITLINRRLYALRMCAIIPKRKLVCAG
jgi:hypothetical protein